MMRVLLDTNVVLDALLAREPWKQDAEAILQASRDSQFAANATSLSVANLFYVRRRFMGLEKAISGVRDCLDGFEILPVDRSTLFAALALPGKDFEDNIQIVAAVEAGLDALVTRNPADFTACPLPVWSPQELLAKLAGSGVQLSDDE
jgi:predicted nucleic acid-binding protein